MKRKLLSLTLALAMCLGLCTLPAAAYDGPAIVQVAAGDASFAVTADGSLWGWGWENPTIMGFDKSLKGRPERVMSDVKSVVVSREANINSTSNYHAFIIKTDGNLYGVGANKGYEMGMGDDGEESYTFANPALIMEGVKQADIGLTMRAAVTNNGDLYIWGWFLGFGLADSVSYPTPTKVLSNVKEVAVGMNHVVALTEDGGVYTMGAQANGCLGNGVVDEAITSQMQKVFDGCIDVAAGRNCTAALRADSTVWLWGFNSSVAKGDYVLSTDPDHYEAVGPNWERLLVLNRNILTPTQVASNARSIDLSHSLLYYITPEGELWGGGSNNMSGVLGVSPSFTRDSSIVRDKRPTDEYDFTYGFTKVDTNVKQVSAGNNAFSLQYSLYLKNDGTMWGMGLNNLGQLGNGRYTGDGLGDVNPTSAHGTGCVPIPILAGLSDPGFVYTPPLPSSGFYDVPDGPYYTDAVKWAVKNGVTTGVSSHTFEPDRDCTRAEIITFLHRAAGSPQPAGGNFVFDIGTSSNYYYDPVLWAAGEELFTGLEFHPSDLCTRAMVVDFLYKLAGSPKVSGATDFTDVPDELADAVSWAVAEGITSGVGNGKFDPSGICTRGQIVTFLYRAFAQ